MAARAIRFTGRPVGLLVWRGAHAWLMTGFRATGDPLLRPPFVVTHVDVVDPWYPRSSATCGRSPRPGMRLPVATLAADFLPFRRPTVRYPDKDGRFVLVLAVLAAGRAAVRLGAVLTHRALHRKAWREFRLAETRGAPANVDRSAADQTGEVCSRGRLDRRAADQTGEVCSRGRLDRSAADQTGERAFGSRVDRPAVHPDQASADRSAATGWWLIAR